jgi:hypothetical protein
MSPRLTLLALNLHGQQDTAQAAVELHRHVDIFCFSETLCDGVDYSNFDLPGFDAYHCARPPGARGHISGGVAVLVRRASGVPVVSVRADTAAGILWLSIADWKLTLAACYFSPPNSRVYRGTSGSINQHPLVALFEGVATARLDGMNCVIMGDLNIRVADRATDLPPEDESFPPDMPAELHDALRAWYSEVVPRQRVNSDMGVPPLHQPLANELMTGLLGACMVLLNGRAAGDEHGGCTYYQTAAQGGSSSTVDLAAVSVALWAAVESFCVMPHEDTASDHCAIRLTLRQTDMLPLSRRRLRVGAGAAVAPVVASGVAGVVDAAGTAGGAAADGAVGGATAHGAADTGAGAAATAATAAAPAAAGGAARRGGRVVLRPCLDDDAYIAALQELEGRCAELAEDLEAGRCSPALGVAAIVEILKLAAANAGITGSATQGAHRGRANPWFDGECATALAARRAAEAAARRARRPRSTVGAEERAALAAAARAARTKWKQLRRRKKLAYARDKQQRLIDLFYSRDARQFWRELQGNLGVKCPIADVHQWTRHFEELMAAPPTQAEAAQLDAEQQQARQELFDAHAQPTAAMAHLNDAACQDELLTILRALPTNKAADAQGLTCELVKIAALPPPLREEDRGSDRALSPASRAAARAAREQPVAPNLVRCLTLVVTSLMQSGQPLPRIMQCSVLQPIPKHHGDRHSMDSYRGICMSSLFSRIYESFFQMRLGQALSAQHLRAITQCGFRSRIGTQDALYTLQHLICKVRHARGQRLYAVFVDFKKAFDMVRRDLLLQRCEQLGVHGPFLQAMKVIYDNIMLRVRVNGRCGPEFATSRGTKQGSELSPLLFGMFIEQLHELIKLGVPGAGPVLGNITVPDILYADDVVLLSMNDPQQAQQLLDCLDLFCTLFDMEVNMGPHKTCAVVFRARGVTIPDGFRPVFRGQEVPIQDSYRYLGLVLHATKSISVSAEALAPSGTRAMHALLGKCKRSCITQFDMKCRLFDNQVGSVLSYGCQVWGPFMFAKRVVTSNACDNFADKVHLSYLRIMAGAARQTSRDVLLRDFNRHPVLFHWVRLAVRWWLKLSIMDEHRLARHAFESDIQLMLDGCKECWSYMLLHTLTQLGVICQQQWRSSSATVQSILQLGFDERAVVQALDQQLLKPWQEVSGLNPRNPALSTGIEKITHAAWVCPLVTDGPAEKAPHMHLCAPFAMLRRLACYRLGNHPLRVRTERMRRQQQDVLLPRQQRHCLVCGPGSRHAGGQHVEDLMHFMLDCPEYQHIREEGPFSNIFRPQSVFASRADHMLHIFHGKRHQRSLCIALHRMHNRRERVLRRQAAAPAAAGGGSDDDVDAPPEGFIPVNWGMLYDYSYDSD